LTANTPDRYTTIPNHPGDMPKKGIYFVMLSYENKSVPFFG
jgi:hypothetical protein